MRFTKIKFVGTKVELAWTTKKLHQEVEHRLTSSQAPAQPLLAALEAFRDPVLRLLELPLRYGDGLRVQSLSINVEEKDGRRGLVVTSLKEIASAHSPLVLNTPHLRERMDEETEKGFLPEEWLRLLEDAESGATRYVNGERAQSDLFADAARNREPAHAGR